VSDGNGGNACRVKLITSWSGNKREKEEKEGARVCPAIPFKGTAPVT
jgi:hypothetical protein